MNLPDLPALKGLPNLDTLPDISQLTGTTSIDFCFLQQADGRPIVGVRSPLADGAEATFGKAPRGRNDSLEVFQKLLSRIPSPDPGNKNVLVSMEDLEADAKTGRRATRFMREAWSNTTSLLAELRQEAMAYRPANATHRKYVRDGFDRLLDELDDWEASTTAKAERVDSDAAKALCAETDEYLATDFMGQYSEEGQLHKAVTNVLRQYHCLEWTTTFAQDMSHIFGGRTTRDEMRLKPVLSEITRECISSLQKSLQSICDKSRPRQKEIESQVNRLSDRLGLPQRTFEKGPRYYIDLGTHAPSCEDWKQAVDNVRSQGWSKVAEAIHGWSGENQYAATYYAEDPQPSKKKSRKKKKKGGSSAADSDTNSQFTESSLGTEPMSISRSSTFQATPAVSIAEDPEEAEEEEKPSKQRRTRRETPLRKKQAKQASNRAETGTCAESSAGNDSTLTHRPATARQPEGQTMDEIKAERLMEMATVTERLEREARMRRRERQRAKASSKMPSLSSASKPSASEVTKRSGSTPFRSSAFTPGHVYKSSRREPTIVPSQSDFTRNVHRSTRNVPLDVSKWPTLGGKAPQIRGLQHSAGTSWAEQLSRSHHSGDVRVPSSRGTDTAQPRTPPEKMIAARDTEEGGFDDTAYHTTDEALPNPHDELLQDQTAGNNEKSISYDDHTASDLQDVSHEDEERTGEGFTLGSLFLDEDMDFEGVDPKVLVTVARYAQHLQEQSPGSTVSMKALVESMDGWHAIGEFLAQRPEINTIEDEDE